MERPCVVKVLYDTIKAERPYRFTPEMRGKDFFHPHMFTEGREEWLEAKLDALWKTGHESKSPEAGFIWWIIESSFWGALAERGPQRYINQPEDCMRYLQNLTSVHRNDCELIGLDPEHTQEFLLGIKKVLDNILAEI